MNHLRHFCSVATISLLGIAAAHAQQAAGATEKAIAVLENQWMQSQKTNNAELMAPLLADKFVNTGDEGKVMNKAQTLADAKATKFTLVEYENLQITVFGDTAIATGGASEKGTDAAGKPFTAHDRFTDTWVKMPDGKWQCVATHASALK